MLEAPLLFLLFMLPTVAVPKVGRLLLSAFETLGREPVLVPDGRTVFVLWPLRSAPLP